ncbi:hypothetical protein [uncultured Tateyamaria sp.]|uniref:hypothetical protein n=1 Tax=uncultured Tateyamaria sp. TaxID=455651 RepID=UPI00261B2449|nr:hypothetical protein [uncultured Tateyamaria sp.]
MARRNASRWWMETVPPLSKTASNVVFTLRNGAGNAQAQTMAGHIRNSIDTQSVGRKRRIEDLSILFVQHATANGLRTGELPLWQYSLFVLPKPQ